MAVKTDLNVKPKASEAKEREKEVNLLKGSIADAFGMLRPINVDEEEFERQFPIYLKTLEASGSHKEASAASGLRQAHVKKMVERYEGAREQYEAAMDIAFDRIEREAVRRAVDGYHRDVWYKGEKVGEELVYSDTLLVSLLKGFRNKDYSINKTELTGKDGSAIEISSQDPKDELAKRLGITIDVTPEVAKDE